MNFKTILILAGDFNLIPCSAIYNYLAKNAINLKETASHLVFSFVFNEEKLTLLLKKALWTTKIRIKQAEILWILNKIPHF